MHAIILAAGAGRRMTGPDGHDRQPKCLLTFDGRTLLARHLEILRQCGIGRVSLVTGYRADLIAQALLQRPLDMDVEVLENPDYLQGSIVSLWTARHILAAGETIVLMDADVLYDQRLLERLLQSPATDCLLMDRNFEAGEEPVKLCLSAGRPVAFSKHIAAGLDYDGCGESVGFFRLSAATAERLAELCQTFMECGRRDEPHEAALGELIAGADPVEFTIEDITGLPWLEIDFPADVIHARQHVLPQLLRLET